MKSFKEFMVEEEGVDCIAVDLDGTLAYYDVWRGFDHIGAPIPRMLAQVKQWIADGERVIIFTARAQDAIAIPPIEKWLEENGIGGLKVTNQKTGDIREIYDDRAFNVQVNTGIIQ